MIPSPIGNGEDYLYPLSEDSWLEAICLKKKFKVEMTVDCKPSLIEHLLEEFIATADFENANVNSYTYYGINNEQEETGRN